MDLVIPIIMAVSVGYLVYYFSKTVEDIKKEIRSIREWCLTISKLTRKINDRLNELDKDNRDVDDTSY